MTSSTDWQDLIDVSALDKNDVTPALLGKLSLAVYDTVDGISVSDARCTHAGALLCDGYFDGKNIECPLHQGLFDAVTGKARAAPATRTLKMYETRIADGKVQIRIR